MTELKLPNTKYNITYTSAMKKDLKRAEKRGYNMNEISDVIFKIANDEPLEEKYHDHALEGNWIGHRELHIRSDWLLIYRKKDDLLILELSRTGSHSDLF
ncbi:MAG: type II toxin-antitoxin system YafQ family toxin [Treponema sp.]|nr:type II toxin-antitoxin system YafQ family toxin [Treponema sp.]MBR6154973.1 type II toxin-antitoxin system YafQ family toxin [Treponema sp.]